MVDNNNDMEVLVLTEEDGTAVEFGFIGKVSLDGKDYYALIPLEDNPDGDYIVLRAEPVEGGEEGDADLVTIDDDDEYDRVADLVEDEFFSEIDYDNMNGNE